MISGEGVNGVAGLREGGAVEDAEEGAAAVAAEDPFETPFEGEGMQKMAKEIGTRCPRIGGRIDRLRVATLAITSTLIGVTMKSQPHQIKEKVGMIAATKAENCLRLHQNR